MENKKKDLNKLLKEFWDKNPGPDIQEYVGEDFHYFSVSIPTSKGHRAVKTIMNPEAFKQFQEVIKKDFEDRDTYTDLQQDLDSDHPSDLF